MNAYIAILRGINVSGKNKIRMAELRQHLEDWDLHGVQTYIQSGNLLFNHDSLFPTELETRISDCIRDVYGFEVPVIVRTAAEWAAVAASNPFLKNRDNLKDKMHVTFLAEKPSEERRALLAKVDYPNEEYELQGRELYLYLPKGYGRAKMNNNFVERKLAVQATTRNWKTVCKLLEMSGEKL